MARLIRTCTASRSKVLLLTPHADAIGGVANYYNALGLDLDFKDVDRFFVNEPMRRARAQVLRRLLQDYRRFWRRLGSNQYRVVLLNPSLNPNSYYRDAVYCWLAALRGMRIVVFFRGWSEDFEARIATRSVANIVFRLTYRKVRHFIILGSSFREKLLRLGCSPDSRFWLESTVADDSYLRDFCIEEHLQHAGTLRILFMSRLVASKGARLAIEAFRLAQRSLPGVSLELVIAGDGPDLGVLKSLVASECIPNVRFIGSVVGPSKRDALLSSDIFLFPTSHGEGMPNVILEAMLYGMPVLTRDVGAIREVVTHGQNGFITCQSNAATFAEWIVQLATDSSLRKTIALNNHAKAMEFYTVKAVRIRLRKIFDELLETCKTGECV